MELRNQIKKRKSKFDSIELPACIDTVSGYHPSCYKYFTSVGMRAKRGKSCFYSVAVLHLSNDICIFVRFLYLDCVLEKSAENDDVVESGIGKFCFIFKSYVLSDQN